MMQLITPNPNIPCQPGWCLSYVNEAFAVPKRYGSATAAWNASTSKHRDYAFPAGWVPLWFSLPKEPNGHVVLRAPDGGIWSTSDLTTTPRRHPDLFDLHRFYAYYGMPLTYLGWTEDVEGTPVIAPAGLTLHGTTVTPLEEDDMSAAAEARIERMAQILEAQENDRIRERIIAIDDRTAGTGPAKYFRGWGDDKTIYENEGGTLRSLSYDEWEVEHAKGETFRDIDPLMITRLKG